MKPKFFVFCLFLFWPALVFAQSAMHFTPGTMSAGGVIAFERHQMDYPSPAPDATVQIFRFAPEFGYFFRSYMAFVGRVGYESVTGDTMESNGFSMGAGLRLVQPLAILHLYAGAQADVYFTSYENDQDTIDFGVSFPLGVLIPLSSSVALDVGARIIKIWRDDDHPSGTNYSSFILQMGYLGVQAFF